MGVHVEYVGLRGIQPRQSVRAGHYQGMVVDFWKPLPWGELTFGDPFLDSGVIGVQLGDTR